MGELLSGEACRCHLADIPRAPQATTAAGPAAAHLWPCVANVQR